MEQLHLLQEHDAQRAEGRCRAVSSDDGTPSVAFLAPGRLVMATVRGCVFGMQDKGLCQAPNELCTVDPFGAVPSEGRSLSRL